MQRKTKLSKAVKPVVMILNSTGPLPFDLKTITFNIYHLTPSLVIGKYQICFGGCNVPNFSSVHSKNSWLDQLGKWWFLWNCTDNGVLSVQWEVSPASRVFALL